MGARKLAGHFAAVCPFALLLGMGVTMRLAPRRHVTPAYSEAQNQRVEAYATLLAQDPGLHATVPAQRRFTDAWIHAGTVSKLEPLTPAFQEELEADNPRAQIIRTWTGLLQSMVYAESRDVRNRLPLEAIQDATRTVRLAEILKYSDFDTLTNANFAARRAVLLLDGVRSDGHDSEMAALRKALVAAQHSRTGLSAMYSLLQANREDYVLRNPGVQAEAGGGMKHDAEDAERVASGEQLHAIYVAAIIHEERLRAASRRMLGQAVSPGIL